jgi:hypothetical protein
MGASVGIEHDEQPVDGQEYPEGFGAPVEDIDEAYGKKGENESLHRETEIDMAEAGK